VTVLGRIGSKPAFSCEPAGTVFIVIIGSMRAIYRLSQYAHNMFDQPSGVIKKGVQVGFATLRRIFFARATAMRVKSMKSGKIMNDGNSGIT
jgi:hypothetical protein